MGEYLLGIDIGTSACKIAVFAKDGQVMAGRSRTRMNGGTPYAGLSRKC